MSHKKLLAGHLFPARGAGLISAALSGTMWLFMPAHRAYTETSRSGGGFIAIATPFTTTAPMTASLARAASLAAVILTKAVT